MVQLTKNFYLCFAHYRLLFAGPRLLHEETKAIVSNAFLKSRKLGTPQDTDAKIVPEKL